jgi:SNF2 family DNA or RNA helicase
MRLIKELRDIKWFHIIADEAHRAKNRKAQLAIALKAIKTRFKTALTGTPADDKPPDIWSILNWLWPAYYRSYWTFVKHYCIFETTDNYGNSPVYRKFVGVQNVSSFHREIEPWYIRRLKEDVLDDLPDKYYSTIWVDLTPAQRRAYDKMKEDMIVWLGDKNDQVMTAPVIIAQLTRLQQFALATMDWDEELGKWRMCDPSAKLDALMQIIQGNPDEPIVVFTQFKTMVRLLEQRLAKAKISCAALTGDVKQSDRGALIDGFQAGKFQIFVSTLATGSEGITLTRSSTVVFLDRSWKPSTNKQAEDRCHRIGQKNAVQIIDLMAKDTVDMGRIQHIENKLAFIKQMLGEL